MQRAHKRKIKVLVVDAAMMFAAVQMTVCMHGKQRYTGKRLPFYIAGISKEKTPNIEIIHIQDNYLREAREVVKANINHVLAVKRGEIEPLRCHCCDYCRETKVLKRPIGIADLVAEV